MTTSLLKTLSFCKLLKRGSVLVQDPLRDDLKFLVLRDFNLRLGIQINHKQLGPIVLKDIYPAFFSADLAAREKFWLASVAVTIALVSVGLRK